MTRSSLKFRAAALCLVLAGLMIVSVGTAQAETGAYWLVNGVKVTTLLPEQVITNEIHIVLLGKIGLTPIHILCKEITTTDSHYLSGGGWLGKIVEKSCEFLTLKEGSNIPLPACTPPGGQFTTTSLKGLIRLSSGAPVMVIEPNSGTTFTTIPTGEECALGETIVIGGKLGLKDAESAFLTDQVTHTMTEHAATTELFLNGNKANVMTFDGSMQFKLTGSHAGLKWSGHPA